MFCSTTLCCCCGTFPVKDCQRASSCLKYKYSVFWCSDSDCQHWSVPEHFFVLYSIKNALTVPIWIDPALTAVVHGLIHKNPNLKNNSVILNFTGFGGPGAEIIVLTVVYYSISNDWTPVLTRSVFCAPQSLTLLVIALRDSRPTIELENPVAAQTKPSTNSKSETIYHSRICPTGTVPISLFLSNKWNNRSSKIQPPDR